MKLLVYLVGSEIYNFYCEEPNFYAISMSCMVFRSFDMSKDRFDFTNSEVLTREELDLKVKEIFQ